MTVFANVETTLVDKGFEVSEQNGYSKTYAKNNNDGGWTEIILDNEYREVIKDVYNANSRQLSHASAPVASLPLVNRLIG